MAQVDGRHFSLNGPVHCRQAWTVVALVPWKAGEGEAESSPLTARGVSSAIELDQVVETKSHNLPFTQ